MPRDALTVSVKADDSVCGVIDDMSTEMMQIFAYPEREGTESFRSGSFS